MRNSTIQDRGPASFAESEPQRLRRGSLGLSTPFEKPQTELELKLATLWEHVLGVETIGAADDFFELGGDSFAATTLAAEIEATFGLRFAPSEIIEFSTVAKQAQAIAAKAGGPRLPSALIAGSKGGSKRPLFMVHGGSGFAFLQPAFVEVVGQDRQVYFFQAPGLDGRVPPLKVVEEIAGLYVRSLREVQPAGPYNIAAMCSGAFIALEMCNQIKESGEEVGSLILLDPDTMPPAWKEARARPGSKSRNRTALDRIPPERRIHVTDAMLKVVQDLREAVCNYVPRPYAGKVVMLVNAKKLPKVVGAEAFWRSHVGDLEYQVGGVDHEELFYAKLADTAHFVRKALEG
jgi:thioesterase domain-containing protein/acyl carrier protein